MPLYEYQCDECGHTFEKIQKFSDPLENACPKCGGPVRKLMSSPAIQFKGSGWYITDYAKKDTGAAKSDGAGDSKTDRTDKTETADKSGSSESKTETPASKPAKPAATAKDSKTT
ncbi:MAG TPA: zinc ribbon domain-containing protein [Vicinamibacterales bacterium]|nr:zinc ribbon domain-containing protein [Vicinamibacterales bacterium]